MPKSNKDRAVMGASPVYTPHVNARLDGKHIVVKCGKSFAVYELIWERSHGEQKQVLVLRECHEVPRQFEREAVETVQDRVMVTNS